MDRGATWICAALFSLAGCSFPVDEFTAAPTVDGAIDTTVGETSSDTSSDSPAATDTSMDTGCDVRCSGGCVDLTSDLHNCGMCGHECTASSERCKMSTCVPK